MLIRPIIRWMTFSLMISLVVRPSLFFQRTMMGVGFSATLPSIAQPFERQRD